MMMPVFNLKLPPPAFDFRRRLRRALLFLTDSDHSRKPGTLSEVQNGVLHLLGLIDLKRVYEARFLERAGRLPPLGLWGLWGP